MLKNLPASALWTETYLGCVAVPSVSCKIGRYLVVTDLHSVFSTPLTNCH